MVLSLKVPIVKTHNAFARSGFPCLAGISAGLYVPVMFSLGRLIVIYISKDVIAEFTLCPRKFHGGRMKNEASGVTEGMW
jgi:hypothetical protein